MVGRSNLSIASRNHLVAAATCLAAISSAAPLHATPSSLFVGTVQWQGSFAPLNLNTRGNDFDVKMKTRDDFDLFVVRNAIGIGGTSGWHTHPGPSLVTVTLGEITLYDAALCTPRHLGVGETFIDEGGDHVHLIRNESGAPAEASAVQIMPRGAARRVDAARPNNCAADTQ